MGDTSNQYVDVGVMGGFLTLILFIAVIVHCFKRVGSVRRAISGDVAKEKRIWAFGVALFSNLVAFFGISYFDQTIVAWYILLASISGTILAVSREFSSQPSTESGACAPWIPPGLGRDMEPSNAVDVRPTWKRLDV
jgi:hypothetical protein